MLAEVVETLKKTGLQAAPPALCNAGPGDVACDFCTGTRRQKALMSCLVCLVSYCETHLQPHYDLPVLKKHKLVKATAQLQEKICSHHDQLLEVYCRTDQQCICYQCMMDEHKGHDTVSAAAERTEKQSQLGLSQQNVQEREKVLKEIQQAVEFLKRSANAAVDDSESIFTELIRSMEERRSEVKELIRAQEKAEVSRAEGLLEQLEQEIVELRRRDAELEQLSHTEDHIHFLQSYQSLSSPSVSSDLPSIIVCPLQYFGDVNKSVSELRVKVEDLLKGEWTKISTTGHNNHSSQMKAALQQDDPMEDKDRGQEVKRLLAARGVEGEKEKWMGRGMVTSSERSRWDVVSKQLESLAKKTTASVGDVEKAIKKYNPKYEDQWSFDALHTFVQKAPKEKNDYTSVFPKIAELASNLPHDIKKAIPLLQKGQTQSITLSQSQIACLLANAFYCTFPHRNSPNPRAEYHNYPTINFNSLFEKWSERKREKLRALLHYFHTVTDPGLPV
ncbi:tripartite motif-containing protein 16-like [Salvelinus alpinus]